MSFYKILIISVFICTSLHITTSEQTHKSSRKTREKKVTFIDPDETANKRLKLNEAQVGTKQKRKPNCFSSRQELNITNDDNNYCHTSTATTTALDFNEITRITELKADIERIKRSSSLIGHQNNDNKTSFTATTESPTFSSQSHAEDEIKKMKKSIKISMAATLTSLTTAGVMQLKESFFTEKQIRRGFDLNASDILGTGSAAQAVATIVKWAACAIGFSGLIYGCHEFWGLNHAQIEAIKKQAKAEIETAEAKTEIALRKQRDDLLRDLKIATKEQREALEETNQAGFQNMVRYVDQRVKQSNDRTLNVIRHFSECLRNSHREAQQDKTLTHKRLEPLVDSLAYISIILEKHDKALNPTATTNESLLGLKEKADRAAELNETNSNTTEDTSSTFDENLRRAESAFSQNNKQDIPFEMPGHVRSINVADPIKEKTCCSSCFS